MTQVASKKLVGFSPGVARRVMRSHAGVIQEYQSRPGGGTSSRAAFFKLLEDWVGDGVLAQECERDGAVKDPEADAIRVFKTWGRPRVAKIGFIGMFLRQGVGAWMFFQGPCKPDCDPQNSMITTVPQTFEAWLSGPEYEASEISWVALTDAPTIKNLPPGMNFSVTEHDDDPESETYGTGTGELTGSPTEEGMYFVTLTGTSLAEECEINRVIAIRVNGCYVGSSGFFVPYPPEAALETEYELEISFFGLAEPIHVANLPFGLTAEVIEYDDDPESETYGDGKIAITGTPTSERTWNVRLQSTSIPYGCDVKQTFGIQVNECDTGEFQVMSAAGMNQYRLPPAIIGVPYYAQVWALGFADTEPITVDGLPDGLSWNPTTRTITGTTNECGLFDLSFTGVSDPNECSIVDMIQLEVECPCPSWPANHPEGETGMFTIQSGDISNRWDLAEYVKPGIGYFLPQEWIAPHLESVWNVEDVMFTGRPPGITFNVPFPPSGCSRIFEIGGFVPLTPGYYTITVDAVICEGDYAGCPIRMYIDFEVRDV